MTVFAVQTLIESTLGGVCAAYRVNKWSPLQVWLESAWWSAAASYRDAVQGRCWDLGDIERLAAGAGPVQAAVSSARMGG
ncbi:hypothetical protein GCM10009634_45220 [Saccharothrix xinjiangensis]